MKIKRNNEFIKNVNFTIVIVNTVINRFKVFGFFRRFRRFFNFKFLVNFILQSILMFLNFKMFFSGIFCQSSYSSMISFCLSSKIFNSVKKGIISFRVRRTFVEERIEVTVERVTTVVSDNGEEDIF